MGLCSWAAAAPGGSGTSGTLMIPGGGHLPAYLRSPERRGLQVRHRSPAPGGHTQAPATPRTRRRPRRTEIPSSRKALRTGSNKIPWVPLAGHWGPLQGQGLPQARGWCPLPETWCQVRAQRGWIQASGAQPTQEGPSRPRKGALVSPPCSLPSSTQPGPWLSAPIANIPTDKMTLYRGTSEGHGPAGQTFLRIN